MAGDRFREGDRIDRGGLKALLREAVAYNTQHSLPKSKGSGHLDGATRSTAFATPLVAHASRT